MALRPFAIKQHIWTLVLVKVYITSWSKWVYNRQLCNSMVLLYNTFLSGWNLVTNWCHQLIFAINFFFFFFFSFHRVKRKTSNFETLLSISRLVMAAAMLAAMLNEYYSLRSSRVCLIDSLLSWSLVWSPLYPLFF